MKEDFVGHYVKANVAYSEYVRGILYKVGNGVFIRDKKGSEHWSSRADHVVHLVAECPLCKS